MDFNKPSSQSQSHSPNMDDQAPSFVIYQDPPEEEEEEFCSTKGSFVHPQSQRIVLAEIRLPSWGNCDSALKYEMRLSSQPEPLSDLPPCEPSSQDFKENLIFKSMQALCLKTPTRKSSPGLKSTPHCYSLPANSNATTRLPPGLQNTPRTYTTRTSLCYPISPYRI